MRDELTLQAKVAELQALIEKLGEYYSNAMGFVAEEVGNGVITPSAGIKPTTDFLTAIQTVTDKVIELPRLYSITNKYNHVNFQKPEVYIKMLTKIGARYELPTWLGTSFTYDINLEWDRQMRTAEYLRDIDCNLFGDNELVNTLAYYAEGITDSTIIADAEGFIKPFADYAAALKTIVDAWVDEVERIRVMSSCVNEGNFETIEQIVNLTNLMTPILTEIIAIRDDSGTPPVETPTVGSLTGDTTASTTDGAGTFSITVDYGTTDGTTPATGSVSTDNTNWTCTDTVCTATTGATTGNVVVTATSSNGLTIPTLTVAITNTDTPVDSSTPATLTADTTFNFTDGAGTFAYTITEGLLADGTTPSTTTLTPTSDGSAVIDCTTTVGTCSVTGLVDGEVITLTASTDTPKGCDGSPATVTANETFEARFPTFSGNATVNTTGGAGTYSVTLSDPGQGTNGNPTNIVYKSTGTINATTGTGVMTLTGDGAWDITGATDGDTFTITGNDIVASMINPTGDGSNAKTDPNPIVVTVTNT